MTWNLIVNHLNAKIREICEAVGADDYMVYITGKNNFRLSEATIKTYKGNRQDLEKPHAYQRVKDYLLSGKVHPVTVCEDWEADDGMSMAQTQGHRDIYDDIRPTVQAALEDAYKTAPKTCICSNDKDLRMVPGYHYSWKVGERIKEKPMAWVSLEEGKRWFFTQLLTGDPTDNILGLYKVGPKATCVKALQELTEPLEMYTKVHSEYECRFGNHWKLFMHENARLLWMLKSEDDDIRNYLDKLESQRLQALRDNEEF